MKHQLFKTLGQVAGLGGIASGVVMVLFREIIQQAIFPMLTEAHAFQLLTLITVLTWSIGIGGLITWFILKRSKSSPAVIVQGGIGSGGNINARDIHIENKPQKPED